MSNTVKKVLVAVCLQSIIGVAVPYAASSWSPAGIGGEKVNVILPMNSFSGKALMVGTDKGIWWGQSGEWEKAWTGLPVHAMAITPAGEPLAVAGNGSDSDGVYLGKITAIAKRSAGGFGIDTRWGFTFQQRHPLPTAVALQRPLDSNCGSVFVGNSAGVASGPLCNGAVGALTALPGPANPFGSFCSAMLIFSKNSTLYAGGNNDVRHPSVVASSDTAWLTKGVNELIRFKKLKVTSLVELLTQQDILIGEGAPEGYSPDIKLVAVGTIDSGVQLFDGDYLYRSIPSPVQNEPVLSIVPFNKIRTPTGFSLTMLVAATPSGVFLQCSPDSSCTWREIGNIPRSPACLAQYNGTTLWAGTDSGVYRYDYATPLQHPAGSAAVAPLRVSAVRRSPGEVVFSFGERDLTGATLDVFDLRGKCIVQAMSVSRITIVPDVGSGMRVYKVVRNGRSIATGVTGGLF